MLEALAGPGKALLGRLEVAVADHGEALEHILHLLLGLGIRELEVAEVVEHPPEPLLEPFIPVVHPAAHLPLDEPGVVEIVALGTGEAVGPGQGARGFVDRSDRLPLHGEDARDFLAKLAARVIELPRGILLGNDPQPDLAALAPVGALDRVEVAGVGKEGDERPGRQLERREVPFVGQFLMLDEGRLGPSGLVAGRRPEGDGHVLVGLGVSGGHLVHQAGGVEPEVVVQLDPDRDHGVGGDVAVGLGLGDDDAGASSLNIRVSYRTASRFRNPSESSRSNQNAT